MLVRIRGFPTHKLALICNSVDIKAVERFGHKTNPQDTRRHIYDRGQHIFKYLEIFLQEKDGPNFDEVIVNVAGGDKALTCAAVSAAFINGLKAFHVMDDMPVMLPILKLSYSEIVSMPKIDILRAIDRAGGEP